MLFRSAEELLEEKRVRGLVAVSSRGEGGDLDPQVIPDGARSLNQALEHELALARHVPPMPRAAPSLLDKVHRRPNLLLEVAQVLLQDGNSLLCASLGLLGFFEAGGRQLLLLLEAIDAVLELLRLVVKRSSCFVTLSL